MKVYEVQQKLGGNWHRVGLLKTKAAARKYMDAFNTKTEVCPTRVIERRVLSMKDVEEDSYGGI